MCVRARARALLPERVGRPLLLTFDNGRTTIILKGLFFPAESALWPHQHTRLYEGTRTMDVGSWRGNRRRVAGHHRTSGLNLSLALFFFFLTWRCKLLHYPEVSPSLLIDYNNWNTITIICTHKKKILVFLVCESISVHLALLTSVILCGLFYAPCINFRSFISSVTPPHTHKHTHTHTHTHTQIDR